ncbi:hypothetical protein Brsp01_49850 [Brucella sp. NBRC 12950]|nr:hypothetical protein Brsp01_49850 [Brucella sp. NBRC 12950]
MVTELKRLRPNTVNLLGTSEAFPETQKSTVCSPQYIDGLKKVRFMGFYNRQESAHAQNFVAPPLREHITNDEA